MYSSGLEDEPSAKELEERIGNYLLAIFRTLNSLNENVSLYLFYHIQNIRRDPFGGNKLDEAYTMYEERANECRRLWMKLRAASGERASLAEAADNSAQPRSRLVFSPSPLEYQSAPEEAEFGETQRNNQVTPMEVDPVELERDVPRPPTPLLDLRSSKSKPKVRLCSRLDRVIADANVCSRRAMSPFRGV